MAETKTADIFSLDNGKSAFITDGLSGNKNIQIYDEGAQKLLPTKTTLSPSEYDEFLDARFNHVEVANDGSFNVIPSNEPIVRPPYSQPEKTSWIQDNLGNIIETVVIDGTCVVLAVVFSEIPGGALTFLGLAAMADALIWIPPSKAMDLVPDLLNPASGADNIKAEDPIILDLNGDGVKTTNLENGTYFDYGNDGFAERTAWADKNDGVLVVDSNNDGKINNATELLVGSTLAAYDTNQDGIIDSNDTNFANIKILKGDGTLQSLADAQIASINLGTTNTDITDANGNNQFAQGTFTKTDGTTVSYGDFNLKTDPASSVETSTVPVSDEIKALPDINGSGTVHSLQQAMAIDTTGGLKTLVEGFVAETNDSNRWTDVQSILSKWTGSENVAIDSRGPNINAQHLTVVEKFLGQGFWSNYDQSANPNAGARELKCA